jgi:hypothetical protein
MAVLLNELLDGAARVLEEYRKAQEMVRDSQDLAANVSKAVEQMRKLGTMLEALAFIKGEGLFPSIEEAPMNELLVAVENIQVRAGDGYLDESDVTELALRVHLMKRIADSLWSGGTAHEIQRIISSLKAMREISDNRLEFDRLIGELAPHEQTVPTAMINARKIVSALRRARDAVRKGGLDSDVEDFIMKIIAGEATLNDISPKLQGWIVKKGLGGRIRLSLS